MQSLNGVLVRIVGNPEVILGRALPGGLYKVSERKTISFPLTKTLRAELLSCGFLRCVFDTRFSVLPWSLARTGP